MNRLFKKTFGWLLCLALAIAMLPVAGRTARGAEEEETQEEAVFSLSDGSITVMDDVVYVNNKEAGTVTEKTIVIEGDSKTATTNTISIFAGEGKAVTVVIRNVNIDESENGFHAISIVGDGNVTIRFEGKNTVKSDKNCAGILKENKGQLIITAMSDASELVAIGGENGAGIGGGNNGSGTNITISGGTVTANGGKRGAGIGGGKGGSGTNIIISGGTVTATGGEGGAGIGGGSQGDGSNIIINREAEVTANGGNSGAGIGGGSQGDGSNIIINRETEVTANGGDSGAGIGGGDRGSGIEIKITEKANVTATGGERGAGIGGGFTCPGKTIKIIGDANVTATGRGGGAGIGGGNGGDGTDIMITDNANVIACGEEGGAGIGGGCDGENSANIKVQNNAVVCVAGGQDGDLYGRGAGIGNGGAADDSFGGIGLPEIEDGDELSLADIIEAPFTGDVRYYLWGTTAEEIANGTAKRRDYCTITLDANDGQGTEKTLEVTEELPSALPANPFVKPGHTIIKWTTEQDGTGESYDDMATIEATGDFTLYVQWSDHVYTETVDENYLVSAADCTEASVYYKSCKCGEKSTETFTSGEPLRHDYKAVEGTAVAPSCEKAGKEADQKCERCGDVITGKEIAATGHAFDKEAVDAKYLKSTADCTHAAVYYKSCACGEKGTETFESGEPLGHKWKAATGYAPKTCESCGATEGDVIKYTVEGGNTIEFTQGDRQDITKIYHRSEDDKDSFAHYVGVQIDGKDTKIEARSGSIILAFDAKTLNSLSVGEHVVTVVFDDWKDEMKLIVKAPAEEEVKNSPPTGDSGRPVLWITLLLLSVAGTSAVVMRRSATGCCAR
ncbi:MAG: InlB B-repeat-containing protein [Lachnospiraceae bacterium]|nr:InlB B-repeat-containing protein [Lachnospiraceae bacterium]